MPTDPLFAQKPCISVHGVGGMGVCGLGATAHRLMLSLFLFFVADSPEVDALELARCATEESWSSSPARRTLSVVPAENPFPPSVRYGAGGRVYRPAPKSISMPWRRNFVGVHCNKSKARGGASYKHAAIVFANVKEERES